MRQSANPLSPLPIVSAPIDIAGMELRGSGVETLKENKLIKK